jgi:phage FluMu protein Com
MQTQSLQEFRCLCGKLLFKGVLVASIVEIKCLRCRSINTMRGTEAVGLIFLDQDGRSEKAQDEYAYSLGHSYPVLKDAPICSIPETFQPGRQFEIQDVSHREAFAKNLAIVTIKSL